MARKRHTAEEIVQCFDAIAELETRSGECPIYP